MKKEYIYIIIGNILYMNNKSFRYCHHIIADFCSYYDILTLHKVNKYWNNLLKNKVEYIIKKLKKLKKHLFIYKINKNYINAIGGEYINLKDINLSYIYSFFGHLECLRKYHENGYPWDKRICDYSASKGHLECLKYAHKNGCSWDDETSNSAAYGGHLECLRYAHENGCFWDRRIYLFAVMGGNLECLKYAHKNDCQRYHDICLTAEKLGRENNSPNDDNIYFKCLIYAHKNGHYWSHCSDNNIHIDGDYYCLHEYS